MPATADFRGSTEFGCLPTSLRALHFADRSAGWLSDAFASDNAVAIRLEEVTETTAGLSRLRDDLFDVVLISHAPPGLDAMELVEAVRAGGGEEQAVVVLDTDSDSQLAALCYEVGADAYLSVENSTTRNLLWTLARAVEYRRLMAENRRLHGAELHRQELEREESQRLLDQQRCLVAHRKDSLSLSQEVGDRYRELLRTYVIMGSGSIAEETQQLVQLHLSRGGSAREAMLMHVDALQEMIHGLGQRSARHVMSRADVLILEFMIHLSDGYRRQYSDCVNLPRQMTLPFAA